MDGNKTAECLNIVGRFLGKRDLPALSRAALKARYGVDRADVMILFGGSVLCGGDVLAQAMQNRVAKYYLIAGGQGHTTDALRQTMAHTLPNAQVHGLCEADLFSMYLSERYRLRADFLERESTNCGNNVTASLALLQKQGLRPSRIIVTQDAAMQLRMEAGFQKHAPHIRILSFAAYMPQVLWRDNRLQFAGEIAGMWQMEQYIALLMGEIPRLRDDADGYGPRGRAYIAHVEIPPAVLQAYAVLLQEFGHRIRVADERYRSLPQSV